MLQYLHLTKTSLQVRKLQRTVNAFWAKVDAEAEKEDPLVLQVPHAIRGYIASREAWGSAEFWMQEIKSRPSDSEIDAFDYFYVGRDASIHGIRVIAEKENWVAVLTKNNGFRILPRRRGTWGAVFDTLENAACGASRILHEKVRIADADVSNKRTNLRLAEEVLEMHKRHRDRVFGLIGLGDDDDQDEGRGA